MEQIPELQSLLSAVERKFGRRVATTTDFEALSVVMEYEKGETLGATTLKRLWGYISQRATPRLSTLDILSRYVGYGDFSQYCVETQKDAEVSAFFGTSLVLSSDLEEGARLTLGWAPNRVVRLVHETGNWYRVEESVHSKLMSGDRFQLSCFFKGCPLVIPAIYREGKVTLPYIAGKAEGLNLLELSR